MTSTPAATLDRGIEAARVSVLEMKLSDGRVDYYVAIQVGDRMITPYKFSERWKAELEVVAFQHVLNNGPPVNYRDFGPEKSIAPVPPETPPSELDRLREADTRPMHMRGGFETEHGHFTSEEVVIYIDPHTRASYIGTLGEVLPDGEADFLAVVPSRSGTFKWRFFRKLPLAALNSQTP